MSEKSKFSLKLLSSKLVFITFFVIGIQTVIFVWLFDLGKHKRWFEHSVEAQLILSFALFLFLFFALYKGIKLKEDLGRIWSKPNLTDLGDSSFLEMISFDGDDIVSFLFSLIIIPFAIITAIYLFTLVISGVVLFVAVLYWVFFRAIRFALKKSNVCKNNSLKSAYYSFGFTLLYTIWFYLIILGLNYFA
jgi:hypothetical protein